MGPKKKGQRALELSLCECVWVVAERGVRATKQSGVRRKHQLTSSAIFFLFSFSVGWEVYIPSRLPIEWVSFVLFDLPTLSRRVPMNGAPG